MEKKKGPERHKLTITLNPQNTRHAAVKDLLEPLEKGLQTEFFVAACELLLNDSSDINQQVYALLSGKRQVNGVTAEPMRAQDKEEKPLGEQGGSKEGLAQNSKKEESMPLTSRLAGLAM